MQILLFSKYVKHEHREHIKHLCSVLRKNKTGIYCSKEICEAFEGNETFPTSRKICSYEDLETLNIDYAITLGGDGTILEATTLIRDLEIPILGINLGRLGFLAGVEKKHIDKALRHLLKGNYTIDERSMLYLESNLPLFEEQQFALNDFAIHKRDTSAMITIKAYINGDYLNTYWADGIVVATPTGSTAYSLSCGGPIIFPGSGNFVITPVAPHNLNVRPIVISDSSIISFEIEGRTENFLCTLDSRLETITTKHQLAVRKCDFKTKLIQINDHTFLSTLTHKLSWGSDRRN